MRERNRQKPKRQEPVARVDAITILMSNGGHALVSPEDYDVVSKYSWHLKWWKDSRQPYASTTITKEDGKRRELLLHRLVTGATKDQRVDHINGDTLDNRRENLRFCTNAENIRNSGKYRAWKCTSKFKGVCRQSNGKFRAQIMCAGKKKNLGSFEAEEAAARAYDTAARQMHGEFARLNFPSDKALAAKA